MKHLQTLISPFLALLTGFFVTSVYAQAWNNAATKPVSTSAVANRVLQEGLATIDIGLHPQLRPRQVLLKRIFSGISVYDSPVLIAEKSLIIEK